MLKLPLTLSVVPENQEAPQLIPELRPFATGENQFPRANASPRPVILLAGFATEVVVLHGALQAMQAGHRVIVALDACGGMSPATEAAAQQQLRDSGAIISSVVSIATALSPDFTSQEGQKLFGIVQALRLA